MFLSTAYTEDPTKTISYTSTVEPEKSSSGTVTTIIVASIIIAVIVVCVVIILILYRRSPLPIIDSDYLTVSNDYMLKDALTV